MALHSFLGMEIGVPAPDELAAAYGQIGLVGSGGRWGTQDCPDEASSRPGARLPHAWLERRGARISSLDCVVAKGLTLMSQGAHDLWAEGTLGLAGFPLVHVRAGEDFTDRDGHWAEVCGLDPEGALLIRPDQHVAWRARSLPANPGSELREALAALNFAAGWTAEHR